MAKVRCEYCGNYIDDKLENCDVCGAVNANHHRTTNVTPKTIEELKSWYIARKLPPEETMRFFIGKDIKEPRAFGIYYDGYEFIVYKNKANGQRAIRYQGTDEAYAVNELYLRLKEEILNQKNQNLNKKRLSHNHQTSYRTSRTYKRKSPLIRILPILIIVMMMPTLMGIFGIIAMKSDLFDALNFNTTSNYYYSNTGTLYYQMDSDTNNDNADWWIYDKETDEWTLYQSNVSMEYLPNDVTEDDIREYLPILAQEINEDYNNLLIYNSRNFIDAGHHQTPSNSYYYHNNKLYYFLNDSHHSITGNDNSGWYVYENDDWSYYCDEDDKEKLGDDLWYADSKYSVGNDITNIYNYDDSLSTEWNPTNFEDTSWYKSYEENNQKYEQKLEEDRDNNDNWDNDNDYDWDDDYDWDYGDTDWDSDW